MGRRIAARNLVPRLGTLRNAHRWLSLLLEVLRVTRLLKDLETNKTKSGLNGARGLFAGIKHHMQAALEPMLWQLGVMLVDT